MAAPKTIKIDVVSDFVCAWCYIGHIELERGMALARSRGLPVDFAVKYHPFILFPNLPEDRPVNKEQFYQVKFGSVEKAQERLGLVKMRAKEDGLDFSFGGNISHSLRAHRLLQRAYLHGGQRAQGALIRRFFRAFFEDEKDVGDLTTLAKLTSSQVYPFTPLSQNGNSSPEITLTRTENDEGEFDPHADDESAAIFDSEEEAVEWIEGPDLEKEVRSLTADAARKGVAGVPFTVIDGRWAVSGCQKPECYYKIFEKLATCSDVPPPAMMKAEGLCGQRICTPSAATA